MTRKEAERIMAEELDISSTYIPRWIAVWERLGMVKFEDQGELQALSHTISCAGSVLTAARVNTFLNSQGFKIVPNK